MSKYGAPASQGGQVFLPFVFETHGLWGKHFQDFFASTMTQAEEYCGLPGAAISMYWRWRISVDDDDDYIYSFYRLALT